MDKVAKGLFLIVMVAVGIQAVLWIHSYYLVWRYSPRQERLRPPTAPPPQNPV